MNPPVSVGVDVSSVERIRRLTERRPEFLTKYFSPEEAEYCRDRPERLAARWAAKEAVRKVFGELGWPIPLYSRIAVSHRRNGAPVVLVEGGQVEGLAISLSHDAGLGVAVAALSPLGRRSSRVWGELPADLEIPARPNDSHKGTFGTVVVIAGSADFPGAAILAGLGALRGGAGKVKALLAGSGLSLAPPELIRIPVQPGGGVLDEAALEHADAALASASAVVCGPGLGTAAPTEGLLDALFRRAAGASWHLVLDADGLNACSSGPQLKRAIPGGSVLTPHPLEASRLAGVDVSTIERDRLGAALELARELRSVIVLKGAGTVVAGPDGRSWVDGHATPVLATGGTGDVLAGLIGALLAQGLDPYQASRTGVFLHGEAGTRISHLRGRAGVLAGEVADALVETQEAVRRQREAEGSRTAG
ncbi:MAG TPA: NAD(P)H-hydrate dehydratase [Candidatus Dormibacteraeota bacterium]